MQHTDKPVNPSVEASEARGSAPQSRLCMGASGYLKNPFTPEEEIVFGDPPPSPRVGPSLYITEIDVENKTVTLGAEPVRECIHPGWQATIYNLELPK